MAPASIYRGPEAKHYAVVHRSQRDPLINDPQAGERVLHQVQRQNITNKQRKKALTRQELESTLGDQGVRSNVGEASSYDIYYDDSEYDYMQHLKPVGLTQDAILLEKPSTTQKKEDSSIKLRDDLIPEPTPNSEMLSYSDHLQYALPSNSAIPENGLLPIDNDPGLREVLDALDDEAYVEEDTEDDFFIGIVKDGERDQSETPDWIDSVHDHPQSQWESEMAKFKKPHLTQDDDDQSIPEQKPNPRSNIHTSVRQSLNGSSFSMSSSSMFRNEGLTDLDDRFDKIEKEYESDDSDEEDSSDGDSTTSNQTATPHKNKATMRADLESIMDEFLDKYEVIGGKMKPVMEGKTAIDKLDTLRTQLLGPDSDDHQAENDRLQVKELILKKLKADQAEHDNHIKSTRKFVSLDDHQQDKWHFIKIRDAIGSTPKTKREKCVSKQEEETQKIGIDRHTGFPIVNGVIIKGNQSKFNTTKTGVQPDEDEDEDDSDSDGSSSVIVKGIIKRDKNEDKEAKKIRKNQLKSDRAARRLEKKNTKLDFIHQKNLQVQFNSKILVKKSNDIAGLGGKGVISLL
ncbi:hypothetical protein KEM48_010077 [Puccinia striiformis f. sp. tritici PST-130]|nr:hypothetical protein KEM48_010077 [Puccinia striiformis f. sp. tritici PST-130]